MDSQDHGVVESRLNRLANMPVTDEESARGALAEVMATVDQINRRDASVHTRRDVESVLGLHDAMLDGIIEKLEKWIDQLVAKLTEIVKVLAGASSFSISIGTCLSVTVNFGPFD